MAAQNEAEQRQREADALQKEKEAKQREVTLPKALALTLTPRTLPP